MSDHMTRDRAGSAAPELTGQSWLAVGPAGASAPSTAPPTASP